MSQIPDFSDQSIYLSVLSAAPAQTVKEFVERLLSCLVDEQKTDVQVISSRTGLAMLPFVDNAKGVTFHLGESLLAEAHVKVGNQEGYAACLGRDLEQAIAIAIVDATLQSKETNTQAEHTAILKFVAQAAHQQAAEESELLRKVQATRIELETF